MYVLSLGKFVLYNVLFVYFIHLITSPFPPLHYIQTYLYTSSHHLQQGNIQTLVLPLYIQFSTEQYSIIYFTS